MHLAQFGHLETFWRDLGTPVTPLTKNAITFIRLGLEVWNFIQVWLTRCRRYVVWWYMPGIKHCIVIVIQKLHSLGEDKKNVFEPCLSWSSLGCVCATYWTSFFRNYSLSAFKWGIIHASRTCSYCVINFSIWVRQIGENYPKQVDAKGIYKKGQEMGRKGEFRRTEG